MTPAYDFITPLHLPKQEKLFLASVWFIDDLYNRLHKHSELLPQCVCILFYFWYI